MHILKTPIFVCKNSENIYLTLDAYSSKTMLEMTQFTVFSRLCQKRHFAFVFKFGKVVRLCKQDLYFYQRCIFVRYVRYLKSVIFQDVLHTLYFKIIPIISQKFESNFWGPKLAHTLYSPLLQKN